MTDEHPPPPPVIFSSSFIKSDHRFDSTVLPNSGNPNNVIIDVVSQHCSYVMELWDVSVGECVSFLQAKIGASFCMHKLVVCTYIYL